MMISFSGVSIFLSGLLLSYFAARRFADFRKNPDNTTNTFYLLASSFVSLAMILYGLPTFFYESRPELLPLAAVLATILNVIGFSYFLKIPLSIWLPPKIYSLASHLASLYVLLIAGALMARIPASFMDGAGIVHWRFSPLQSCLIIALNALAFGLNIAVLYKNFRPSWKLSWIFKLLAITATFILTGLGGGYLYVGDDGFLLKTANTLLLIGILTVFIASFSFRASPEPAPKPAELK